MEIIKKLIFLVILLIPSLAFATPTALGSISALASGQAHTCAFISGGTVKCWGNNDNGQLGDGTTVSKKLPVAVSSLTGVASIGAGADTTCAVVSAALKCWGGNLYGQIGDTTSLNTKLTATAVGTLTSGVSSVKVGDGHICVTTTSNGVKCLGRNENGQLGNNTIINTKTAVNVTGLTSGVSQIALGGNSSCALITATGGIKCWGGNDLGQIGDGTYIDRSTPVDVSGLTSGYESIWGGGTSAHFCAIKSSDHTVRCWGENSSGQLGNGNRVATAVPVTVTGISTATKMILGNFHTCSVLLSGAMKCWGQGIHGQLGNGNQDSLVIVSPSVITTNAVEGVAGSYHTCVKITGSVAQCWGMNRDGQLSDDTYLERLTPVDLLESS